MILLEDALVQAIYTVAFLHDCLMYPEYSSYKYPEQTGQYLDKWQRLVTIPPSCGHSYYAPGRGEECKGCEEHMVRRRRHAQALWTIGDAEDGKGVMMQNEKPSAKSEMPKTAVEYDASMKRWEVSVGVDSAFRDSCQVFFYDNGQVEIKRFSPMDPIGARDISDDAEAAMDAVGRMGAQSKSLD